MMNRLLLLTSLAAMSFAASVPRPAGEVPFDVPGKGKDLLSNYRGKVVLFAAIITT